MFVGDIVPWGQPQRIAKGTLRFIMPTQILEALSKDNKDTRRVALGRENLASCGLSLNITAAFSQDGWLFQLGPQAPRRLRTSVDLECFLDPSEVFERVSVQVQHSGRCAGL